MRLGPSAAHRQSMRATARHRRSWHPTFRDQRRRAPPALAFFLLPSYFPWIHNAPGLIETSISPSTRPTSPSTWYSMGASDRTRACRTLRVVTRGHVLACPRPAAARARICAITERSSTTTASSRPSSRRAAADIRAPIPYSLAVGEGDEERSRLEPIAVELDSGTPGQAVAASFRDADRQSTDRGRGRPERVH